MFQYAFSHEGGWGWGIIKTLSSKYRESIILRRDTDSLLQTKKTGLKVDDEVLLINIDMLSSIPDIFAMTFHPRVVIAQFL